MYLYFALFIEDGNADPLQKSSTQSSAVGLTTSTKGNEARGSEASIAEKSSTVIIVVLAVIVIGAVIALIIALVVVSFHSILPFLHLPEANFLMEVF